MSGRLGKLLAQVRELSRTLRSSASATGSPRSPRPRTARRHTRLNGATPPPNGGPPPAVAQRLDASLQIEYAPDLDGDADPGEVVWTWVPYDEDPNEGKDRPVVIIGRSAGLLVGVPLTSKHHPSDDQVEVGTGAWDSAGRVSYAKVDHLLRVDARRVRREGAVLARDRFDAVVRGVQRHRAAGGG